MSENNKELNDLLNKIINQPLPEFKPHVWYNTDGDMIEVYWKKDNSYGVWINHNLTLLKSQDTDEVVGVLIEDVSRFIGKNE